MKIKLPEIFEGFVIADKEIPAKEIEVNGEDFFAYISEQNAAKFLSVNDAAEFLSDFNKINITGVIIGWINCQLGSDMLTMQFKIST